VTDASSKSLKLLPMLGVPSLPSLPLPFLPGLLPANSAVRRGLRGPGPDAWSFLVCVAGADELALESLVCEISVFLYAVLLVLLMPLGSPRSVADGS